jgi:hypothetical protein
VACLAIHVCDSNDPPQPPPKKKTWALSKQPHCRDSPTNAIPSAASVGVQQRAGQAGKGGQKATPARSPASLSILWDRVTGRAGGVQKWRSLVLDGVTEPTLSTEQLAAGLVVGNPVL